MSFLHPEFLYYMLPALTLLFGFLLTQKEPYADLFAKEVMDRLRSRGEGLSIKARTALFFLMGVLMIFSLAEPVIEDEPSVVKSKSSDIVIALDISDSMLAEDIYPNRLEAAKQKALTLISETQGDRIGIVAFAKNSYLVSPLSFDTKAVSYLLSNLSTTSITQKGSDILALLEVVGKLDENRDEKILLILSDGADSSNFDEHIAMAKKYNIRVFILATATDKGAPIKLQDGTFIKESGDIVISKLNEKVSDLATKTGGVYIQSSTSLNDIKRMLQEIKAIALKKESTQTEIKKHTPLFYYPLWLALVILLIATSSIKFGRSALVLLLLLLNYPDAKAAIFDFMDLKRAKEAYENGRFEESAKLYESYAKESSKPEAYYNAANGYYKMKKYKEAIELYSKATFNDNEKNAENLSNLGNAYAKNGSIESLQKAKESYEKSLKLKEDKPTRENLLEVEKLLNKPKDENKKEQQQDKQESKDQKNEDSKDSKDSDSSRDEKENSKEAKEQKSDQEKSQQDQKESSNSGSEKEDLKKDEVKELKKSDDNKTKDMQSTQEQMSDAEEHKWLDQLGGGKGTYLYRLGDEKSSKNEKPW